MHTSTTGTSWSFVPMTLLGNNHFLILVAGIFIVLVNFFLEPSSIKIFFLMRGKAKNCFPIMWNRNTFFHKSNTLATQIQQHNIFFSSRWRHKFFFNYNAKSKFFRSARALKYFFQKNPRPPPDKKMVVA